MDTHISKIGNLYVIAYELAVLEHMASQTWTRRYNERVIYQDLPTTILHCPGDNSSSLLEFCANSDVEVFIL